MTFDSQFSPGHQPDADRRRGGRPRLTHVQKLIKRIQRRELADVESAVTAGLDLARANTPAIVQALVDIALDGRQPAPSRIEAAREILLRSAGRVPLALEVDARGTLVVQVEGITSRFGRAIPTVIDATAVEPLPEGQAIAAPVAVDAMAVLMAADAMTATESLSEG